MSNIRFLWNNTGLDSARLAPSSAKTAWPGSNLQDTMRGKVWMTDGTGRATLDVDFGKEVVCSAVGLVEHNLAYDATYTVKAYSGSLAKALDAAAATDEGGGLVGIPLTGHGYAQGDLVFISGTDNYNGLHTAQAGGTANKFLIQAAYGAETFAATDTAEKVTLAFSKEFDAWDPVLGWGEGGWGEYGWGGAPDDDFLATVPKVTKADFFDPTVARYWRVEFDNGGETSAFEFYVGRLFLCRYFEPSYNIDYGWPMGLDDPSLVDESLGGQRWVDEKEQFYWFEFTLGHLLEGEVYGELLRLVNWVGVRREMVLQIFGQTGKPRMFTTAYGTLERRTPITNAYHKGYQARLRFTESR